MRLLIGLSGLLLLSACVTGSAKEKIATPESVAETSSSIKKSVETEVLADGMEKAIEYCVKELEKLPGPKDMHQVRASCQKIKLFPECQSVSGQPIFHYDKEGTSPAGQRILAVSLIHGDEMPAGSVSRAWMSRLETINPRNSWRLIPIANPDGWHAKTRYNKNGVDINRNFPSSDWDEKAQAYWQDKTKKDRRRFPGTAAGSEPETRCLVKQIDDFNPDLIISVHTPLGVLDFDGPPVGNPGFKPLPWLSLGNFPGSLGRYMWVDRNVPVLTIELKGNSGIHRLEQFDRLQDVSGTVAIQAAGLLEKEKKQASE